MNTNKRKPRTMSSIHLPGLVNPHDLSADRQFSMNLARGMEVLRAFTLADSLLGNREIADRTGLPKPTVSRLTYTLTLLGYLSRVDKLQKYRLGSGVLSLGYPLLANMRVRQIARPIMEKVARETGCNVNLGMRDRTNVVYVDTCRVDQGNVYQPDIGSTRPLLSTAIGRALILASPPAERKAILNRLKIEDPQRFELDKPLWEADQIAFAERGYCYSRGDWHKDIHALAVPIRQMQREEPMALNCTLSVFRLGKNTLEKLAANQLLEAVQQIEVACGLH
ncbi:IclR family transcriptional regulator [Polaromonas sp. SM01]|uniref:IclR family transcriptional regulator n=1 Tax=Polaromonas sp. SM01 TaxID=3085630 RepID=UPI00399071AC